MVNYDMPKEALRRALRANVKLEYHRGTFSRSDIASSINADYEVYVDHGGIYAFDDEEDVPEDMFDIITKEDAIKTLVDRWYANGGEIEED